MLNKKSLFDSFFTPPLCFNLLLSVLYFIYYYLIIDIISLCVHINIFYKQD